MAISIEWVQTQVKAWVVGEDPEVEVQTLPPRDDSRQTGQIVPVRLQRHGYRMTVAFPEDTFSGSPLPEATRRTLGQIIRLLRYMEKRHLPRPGTTDHE